MSLVLRICTILIGLSVGALATFIRVGRDVELSGTEENQYAANR